MSALKSECRKFQPNVFNKSKCQNCFRTKECHSAEALENNRASRNVSKCGYLFVAPDWDFSVSVNRTKRWQRRWFVLYDDGELTYSLDEFPETIPQGKIDMNSVLEVSDAEGVTGNEFALAIATSEKVHFVKGTSREESKWWFDVLSKVLPRHLIRKHKRNATFPCGNVTIPSPAIIAQELCTEDDLHLGTRRPKFLSTSELQRNDVDWIQDDAEEDVFSDEVEIHNALNDLMSAEPDGPTSQTEEQIQKDYLSQLEELESRRRNRRYLKRENRVQRNQRGRIAKMIPARNRTESSSLIENNASAIAAAEKLEYLESIHSEEDQKDNWSQCDPDLTEVSPKNVTAYSRNPSNLRKSESLRDLPKETNQVNGIRRYHSFKSATSAHKRVGLSSLKRTSKNGFGTLPRSATSTPLRQDNDLKNLTSNVPESPSSDLSYEHSEDGVFRRTGWLFRETLSRDWSRHWFVLQDASLSYYRDPHSGIMDGILDLNQVSSIRETKRDRHYAFSLLMWDGKKHVLASESHESRERWLQALQYASNLWSSASKEDFICNEIILPEHSFNRSSLDASHGYSSDDQSEYFSLVDEDEQVSELSSSPRTLPPSPPINRNMMSMVKEKSRIRHPKTNHDKDTLCSTLADGSIEVSRVNGNYQSNPLNIANHKPDEIQFPLEFDKQVLNNFPSATYNCDITSLSNSSSPVDECPMCFSVKSKLVTAKEEIRKLKRELKEAHSNFDNLEMLHYKIAQDMKAKEDNYNSQISLMTAKIDDLTSKFSVAEKNYRQLKQKSAKTDGKERKRSSLKNREGLSLTKEYEQKLCDLEKKIGQIEIIFDRRSSETDSESINSLVQSKIEDFRLVPSELSDTSTSTDLSTSSGKGFFARLQSLGTKIQNVDINIAERNRIAEEVESPQICLQVQEKDVPSHIISEEWCSIPIATDLNCVAFKTPESILDCQMICIQKVNDILNWLNNSLKNISKNVSMKNQLSQEKVELVRNIISFIDPLCEEIFPEMIQSNKINIHKSFLWSLEILKTLERIESFENMDGLIKFDVTENAFKILFKTFVLTFAEYNNTMSNDILQMIANLPQIRFFCPVFTNFFPELESSNDSETSIHNQWQSLIKEKSNILKSIQQLKNLRYESLWNTLTEVPVQESSSTKRSKSASSILNNVISISTDIHRTAEHQITGIKQRCFLLKEENDQVQLWCTSTVQVLKDGLLEFLDEIKEQCPMIYESTVALSDLGESTRKEITSCVSELSVLSVFHLILQKLLSYSVKVSETTTSGDTDSWSAQQEWSQHIWRNYTLKGVTFSGVPECSQCILLNQFLSGRQSWEDFVLNYKLCSNQCNDYLTSRYNIPRCLNCESHFQTNKANDVCNNLKCTNCENWIQKVYSSEKQHALDKKELEVKHGEEIEQLEECLIKSTELHDKELSEKEIELCHLKTQLQRFQNDHEEQMSSLKHLYEQNLHFDYNNLDEDKIRRKYQLEIQDLKELFKKGLVAIENSHYRITTEMEKRHQEQILQLKLEKEEALELEAKATLTALKAIKKSHDERLLDETAIIKENLIKKMQHNDNSDLFLEKYGSDLVQLKSEIVTMTEMYSTKCLENIALEERLDTLRDQLEEAHNQLCDLLSKNRDINLSPLAV